MITHFNRDFATCAVLVCKEALAVSLSGSQTHITHNNKHQDALELAQMVNFANYKSAIEDSRTALDAMTNKIVNVKEQYESDVKALNGIRTILSDEFELCPQEEELHVRDASGFTHSFCTAGMKRMNENDAEYSQINLVNHANDYYVEITPEYNEFIGVVATPSLNGHSIGGNIIKNPSQWISDQNCNKDQLDCSEMGKDQRVNTVITGPKTTTFYSSATNDMLIIADDTKALMDITYLIDVAT